MSGHIQTAARSDWTTPQKILDPVREVFGGIIHLDPCDNQDSVVQAKVSYRLPEVDGLVASWDYPTIFINPPYGKTYMERGSYKVYSQKEWEALADKKLENYRVNTIADWIERCVETVGIDRQVIALIPTATDTKHWYKYIWGNADSVCFVKGRLRFGGAVQSAPFASAVVYWGYNPDRFSATFAHLGKCVSPLCSGFCN